MTNFEAVLSSLPPVGSSAPDRSVASRATAATARHRTARGCRDLRGAVSVRSRGRPWLKGRKYGKWQIHIYIYMYIYIYLSIYLFIYLFIYWLIMSGNGSSFKLTTGSRTNWFSIYIYTYFQIILHIQTWIMIIHTWLLSPVIQWPWIRQSPHTPTSSPSNAAAALGARAPRGRGVARRRSARPRRCPGTTDDVWGRRSTPVASPRSVKKGLVP